MPGGRLRQSSPRPPMPGERKAAASAPVALLNGSRQPALPPQRRGWRRKQRSRTRRPCGLLGGCGKRRSPKSMPGYRAKFVLLAAFAAAVAGNLLKEPKSALGKFGNLAYEKKTPPEAGFPVKPVNFRRANCHPPDGGRSKAGTCCLTRDSSGSGRGTTARASCLHRHDSGCC